MDTRAVPAAPRRIRPDATVEPNGPDADRLVILIDTAFADTLLALVLDAPQGIDYNTTFTLIKIGIRPRLFLIKVSAMTLGAILKAHGLAVLAPALTRILTDVLNPLLDWLSGPDTRHETTMKLLDGLTTLSYAEDGSIDGSNALRSWSAKQFGERNQAISDSTGTPGPAPVQRDRPPASTTSTTGDDKAGLAWEIEETGTTTGQRPATGRTGERLTHQAEGQAGDQAAAPTAPDASEVAGSSATQEGPEPAPISTGEDAAAVDGQGVSGPSETQRILSMLRPDDPDDGAAPPNGPATGGSSPTGRGPTAV
ncbi:hypothetical protein [Actinoallomurus bryophytorum]|uniref:hypothetical protein n=1 Tax=Actinoallomurus bryophytorum TaxID=1490222 RepID=UPI001150E1F0|nr:hypothetical protein [Actinoallomurus bryophytorum]